MIEDPVLSTFLLLMPCTYRQGQRTTTMNVETQGINNELDLGTEFQIDFRSLSRSETSYTVHQLTTALEATTTLTELGLLIEEDFEPGAGNNQSAIVDPLCRCIANLRLQNEHHPLRSLVLVDTVDFLVANGLLDTFQQFLTAAKQYGIRRLKLFGAHELPMQVLVDFCRGNNDLKDLDMDYVFACADTTVDRPLDASFVLALDKLVLDDILLRDDSSATDFADLVARMNFSVLTLGRVSATDSRGNSCARMMSRIASEVFKSPLDQLTLLFNCELPHFQAALEAAVVSVTDLTVYFPDDADTFAKVERLVGMIRGAIQLSSLAIENGSGDGFDLCRFNPPPQLFQAIEACATLTRIEVNHHGDRRDFSPDQVQQLQKVTTRNKELNWFRVNPCIYPTRNLPALMCQFDNCPTGRYMLARRLPELLSFEKLCGGTTAEPNQKKRKAK